MDSLTQLTLGAAVGEAVLGRKIGNKAIWLGGLFGTIPDLDVLLNFALETTMKLRVHRGYSHSIIFAVIFGALAAWALKKIFKKEKLPFNSWYLFTFLTLVTHPILDSFTTYGTQLFLPFSDYRVGFNNIFVADLFYTIPLLAGVVAALFFLRNNTSRRLVNWLGIGISSLYMLFTFGMKFYTNSVFETNLALQKIPYERYTTSPTPLNAFFWGITAEGKDGYWLGHYSIFDKQKDNIEFTFLKKEPDLRQRFVNNPKFENLTWFSSDYYILTQQPDRVDYVDLRFGPMDFDNIDRTTFPFYFKIKDSENGNDIEVFESREVPELDGGFKVYFNRYWARVFGKVG